MFDRLVVLGATAASLMQGPAAARSTGADLERIRRMTARAESLSIRFDSVKTAERARVGAARRAHVVQGGRLTGLFWSSIPDAVARGILLRADSMLTAFGAIPDTFLARSTPVQMWTSGVEEAFAQPVFRGHQRVMIDWAGRLEDTLGVSDRLAFAYGRRYLHTLDHVWQDYLFQYGIVWRAEYEGAWVLRALAESPLSSGQGCLAGRPAACRTWLGLDPVDHPILQRYSMTELRRTIESQNYLRQDQDWRPCAQGADDACVRLAERRQVVATIPAGNDVRESVMRALLALHGSRALASALIDSTGSLGQRLARAAGVSEDSLVSEWRVWVLSRGRPQRVRAGLGDASVALLTVVILVAITLKGAKWR